MRFDPSSPGLLSRLPDDGDGMDQARHTPALARPGPENSTPNKVPLPFKKGGKMHTDDPEEHPVNARMPIPESGEIAYNLDEEERPDGLKVRFKITIATGAEARELDARQAETIWRLLQWAQQNQHSHPVRD